MVLVMSGLLQQGMFMDGIQYACVSKNLAEGYGTFWFPFLSPFWCQNGAFHFFEHPPLFYFLESLFFRIPGAGAYAEKLFCAVMWFLNALFIYKLWKLIHPAGNQRQYDGWLPILLWTITPVCFWCFQNNMIEIVVSFFVLGSVYFGLRFLMSGERKIYSYLLLSAVFLYGSFLTKGLVGLFPLGMFLIYSVTHKDISFKKAFGYSILLVLLFSALFFAVYLLNSSANYTLNFYFKERLISRIEQTPTTSNRFELLFDLVSQLLPVLIISFITYGVQRLRKRVPAGNEGSRWLWFFLLMALSGSLPIMLTMVQKGFYFMPSLAFYALAFAIFILGFFRTGKINEQSRFYKMFRGLSYVLALASIIFCFYSAGRFSRDEAMLKEVDVLGEMMVKERTINVDMTVYCTWNYQFYLQRYHRIYLDPTPTYRRYLLTDPGSKPAWINRYKLVKEFGSGFGLYERK